MLALVRTTSWIGVVVVALGLLLTLIAAPVDAQTLAQATINANTTGLTATGTAAYGTGTPVDLPSLIGRFISIAIFLSGLVVFLILIYGGFIWMTAQGDTDKVKKAQSMIAAAVIGLAVVMSAYAIAIFVVNEVINATATG